MKIINNFTKIDFLKIAGCFFVLFFLSCAVNTKFSAEDPALSEAPVVGSEILITDPRDTKVNISWGSATDNISSATTLEYKLIMANSIAEIDTVEKADACKNIIMKWAPNITNFEVTGLTENSMYAFAVLVMDGDSNIALYTPKETMTTPPLPDTEVPIAGNSGRIAAGSVTANSLILYWEEALDASSKSGELLYAVYKSNASNISTVEECTANGILITDYTPGIKSCEVTGLNPETVYYFAVIVKDPFGNKSIYSVKTQSTNRLPDTTAPVSGSGGIITTDRLSQNSVRLLWTAATDNIIPQTSLKYAVYRSSSNNISTVEECENNGTMIQIYTSNLTQKDIVSLNSDTTYYFNVIIKDIAGNKSIYTTKEVTTATAIPGLIFSAINNGSEYSVTCGTPLTNTIVIPDYYSGKPVTVIGDNAFIDKTSITSITLPDSIKSIGNNAFS